MVDHLSCGRVRRSRALDRVGYPHQARVPRARRTGGATRTGRVPVHARSPPRRVPRAGVDDAAVRRVRLGRGDEPPLPPAARPRSDRPLGGLRPAHPSVSTPTIRSRAARSATPGVAIDSMDDMRTLLDGIPLDAVSTSMTINATAATLLLLYLAGRRRAGHRVDSAHGHDPKRHPKGVHRSRHLHFPHPADMRLTMTPSATAPRAAELQHYLDLGYHIREAGSTAAQEIAFTLANGSPMCRPQSTPALRSTIFATDFLLLQRAQPLLEEIAKFRAARRLWGE